MLTVRRCSGGLRHTSPLISGPYGEVSIQPVIYMRSCSALLFRIALFLACYDAAQSFRPHTIPLFSSVFALS